MVRIAQQAIAMLEADHISVELIDIQTLLPFDCDSNILESIKKTNRVAVLDEDVPGGASGFILQQIIEEQGAYQYLDSPPITFLLDLIEVHMEAMLITEQTQRR